MSLEIVCQPGGKPFPAERMLHGRLSRPLYDTITALSNSVMKKWLENEATPSKFAWWLKNRWTEPPTPAMSMGLALDHMLLEPTTFPDRFVILPEDGHKTVTEKDREKYPGKVVLSHAQWVNACEMARSLMASGATAKGAIFQHCQKAVATAELFGEPWKGEFDLWDGGRTDTIADVKTTRDVSPGGFARQAVDLGYFYQATIYLMLARALGYDKKVFSFVCVLNDEPWTVKAYRFAPYENDEHHAAFHGCQAKLAAATRTLLAAMKNNFADDSRWEDLTLPGWFMARLRWETKVFGTLESSQ